MSILAVSILGVVLLVGAVVIVLLKAQRRERTDPTCGRCGYNLTGSESNRCPECGTLFIEAGVTTGSPSPKSPRWVLVSLLVLSILFVAGIGLSVSYRAANRARAQARLRAIYAQAAAAQAQQQKSSRAGSAPAAVRQAPVRQQQSTTSIDGQPGALRPVSTGDTWNRPRTEEAAARRREMVSRQIEARGVADPKVLDAMRNVPRHWFVSSRSRNLAYSDRPLPIGDGQTISQPYIIALMTESLHLTAESKVLEIGTGSGYQAAVLSDITPHVFTIEIVEPLARRAIATFKKHGYDSIETRLGDGYAGWVEHAPYDGIIVTCAPDHIPPKLIEQLRTGGRICIPVGGEGVVQKLVVVTKRENGRLEQESLIPVRFVPMTGEARTRKTGDSGD